MDHDREEIEIDLREIFYLIKRKALLIILVALIVSVGTGIVSMYGIDAKYASTSKLYIITSSTSITSLADVQVGTSLTTDYLELVKSRPVVYDVIDDLKLDTTYTEMLSKLTVENPTDTRIVNITVTDTNPKMAEKIVNDFATVAQKHISEIMKTEEPSIVEKGIVASSPVSPNKKLNVIIGFLIGLLGTILVLIIRYIMDDTIKTTEDVEKYLGLNTLASVPLKDGVKKEKKRALKKKRKRAKHGK